MRLRIIIDTREQRPWSFPAHIAEATIGTLKTGDYALDSDTSFAIERKSVSDFAGTISSGWSRFLRELDRMETWPARVVIVEGSFSDLMFTSEGGNIDGPNHNHWRVTPAFALKRIGELLYMGVAVVFAESPEYSAAICCAVLKERQKERDLWKS